MGLRAFSRWLKESHRRTNIFKFGLNHGLTSNKPTRYILVRSRRGCVVYPEEQNFKSILDSKINCNVGFMAVVMDCV